jgi:hypothetical protein
VWILQKHKSRYFTFQFSKQKLKLKSIYIFGESCSSCYTEHSKIEFAILDFLRFLIDFTSCWTKPQNREQSLCMKDPRTFKSFTKIPLVPPFGPDGDGKLAGGEVEHGHANKLRESSIGLTRERLVEKDRPGKSPASGGCGAVAARPRELTRR